MKKTNSMNLYVHSNMELEDRSPSVIVPMLVKTLSPKSVVDVGCGIGNWLKAFENNGVHDLLGIDGLHLAKEKFIFDQKQLVLLDLEEPFNLDRRFDMAVSLEVAEHLSEQKAASFIQSLCNLSDVILFSAAVPGQGGQNHLNEQWPSYWKDLFQKNGYNFYDYIRPLIWETDNIRPWYKQNMFLAIKASISIDLDKKEILDLYHPDIVKLKLGEIERGEIGVKYALHCFLNAVKLKLRNLWR